MSAGDLPSSEELLAHIDTALDAVSQWLWRGQASRVADQQAWEDATYFGRVLLVRASDRFEQLGYVLQREALADQPQPERQAVKAALAYVREVDVDLQQARQTLDDLSDTRSDDLGARKLMRDVHGLVETAAVWIDQMARTLDDARGPERQPPSPALGLVPEQSRGDDGWQLDIA